MASFQARESQGGLYWSQLMSNTHFQTSRLRPWVGRTQGLGWGAGCRDSSQEKWLLGRGRGECTRALRAASTPLCQAAGHWMLGEGQQGGLGRERPQSSGAKEPYLLTGTRPEAASLRSSRLNRTAAAATW